MRRLRLLQTLHGMYQPLTLRARALPGRGPRCAAACAATAAKKRCTNSKVCVAAGTRVRPARSRHAETTATSVDGTTTSAPAISASTVATSLVLAAKCWEPAEARLAAV